MSADPHYWVGYLAHQIACAIKRKDTEPLRGALDDFMRSKTATPALCATIREEMRNGQNRRAAGTGRRHS